MSLEPLAVYIENQHKAGHSLSEIREHCMTSDFDMLEIETAIDIYKAKQRRKKALPREKEIMAGIGFIIAFFATGFAYAHAIL